MGIENDNGISGKRIGIVVNTVVKPSRDVLSNVVHYIHSENLGKPLLFQASGGTLPENIKSFASNGLDGMIICGVRRESLAPAVRLRYGTRRKGDFAQKRKMSCAKVRDHASELW